MLEPRPRRFRRLGLLIVQYEKRLLAALAVIIVVSGSFWARQLDKQEGPTAGGSYVEGVVLENGDFQPVISRLTRTGLFAFDANGALQPQLVSGWSVNAEFTEYRFELKSGIDPSEIVKELENQAAVIGSSDTKAEGSTVILTLAKASKNLPMLLTFPMFEYGPYKVGKLTNQTVVFNRNTDPNAPAAYINRVLVHKFSDQASLDAAIKNQRLDAGIVSSVEIVGKAYDRQTVLLPQYYAIIFNVNRSPFRDSTTRSNVVNGQAITNSFVLTAADEEPYKTMAENAVASWKVAGIKVELELKPTSEIDSSIAPQRNFQALLVKVNYGYNLNPLDYWHSSAVRPPGKNLSGIKSDKIDQLLEANLASTNINERRSIIEQIHAELVAQGVAKVIKQESYDFATSSQLNFQQPWLSATRIDRLLGIPYWSVK